jgi:16S rRNA (uracil1498-N3)-methyltransferase
VDWNLAEAAAQVFVEDPAAPALSPPDAHHVFRVLRLRPGEAVVASDGRGRWVRCMVGDGVLERDGPVETEPAETTPVTVAFAPVKGERTDWAVQKLTELGCDRIVPLATERGVVRWSEVREDRALERLRRVVAEAAAQSRRVWIPEVTSVMTLAELVAAGPVALAVRGAPAYDASVTTIAVGPEGGWTSGELAIAPSTVGLGPTVLRTETAAVAGGAVMIFKRVGIV